MINSFKQSRYCVSVSALVSWIKPSHVSSTPVTINSESPHYRKLAQLYVFNVSCSNLAHPYTSGFTSSRETQPNWADLYLETTLRVNIMSQSGLNIKHQCCSFFFIRNIDLVFLSSIPLLHKQFLTHEHVLGRELEEKVSQLRGHVYDPGGWNTKQKLCNSLLETE